MLLSLIQLTHMSTLQLIRKNKGLIKAFMSYQKRFLSVGKKPDMTKSFPEIVYRTTRLEGEVITKKQAQALFNN